MDQKAAGTTAVRGDFVGFHALARPDKLAAMDMNTGIRWSYRELDDRIARCATVLASRGLRRGDRLCVLARNSVDLLVLHFACIRLGVIVAILNWRLKPAELSAILADAQPMLVVADASCADLAEGSGDAAPRLPMADLLSAIDKAPPASREEIDLDAPSLMLYTSGTSGVSKGVLISERSAYFTGSNFGLAAQIGRESALLCEAPLFHVIGLVIGLRACIQQGATFLISDGFEPMITNGRLADPELGVTHYFCVPQMAAALRSVPNFDPAQFDRLKALIVGGAPSDPRAVLAWLDDGIAYTNGYGMTEIGSGAGMPAELASISKRPRSVGLVPPTQRMKTVDGEGGETPAGTPGEIWVKGPNVCLGYWKRPEETAQAFSSDGWFKTGDIGVFDDEGYLTLVDRKKDMLISGGENVYPAEVELVLQDHPGVAEVAVVGIADERWGEVGCAFIIAREGSNLTHDDLRRHCIERIAGYKAPKYYVVVETIPRSGAGKILKRIIKAEFAAGLHTPIK